MTIPDEKVLAGVAGLLVILIVGTLFGRLHAKDDATIKPVGDRVACGLLALPLISVAVRLAFPSASLVWVLGAPLPLAVYVVLLAGTDQGWAFAREKRFTQSLLIGIGLVLIAMALWTGLSS